MADLQSFDRVAHLYDETRGMPADAERQIGDRLAELLRGLSAAPRLLETGIGTGRIAVPLAERGIEVVGIDISRKMLQILLGKRRDIALMLAEAAQPPLRDGAFDAALFVHILHLVPDAPATVRATTRAVRPGGLLIEAGESSRSGARSQVDGVITEAVRELSGVDILGGQPYEAAQEAFAQVMVEAGATVTSEEIARWTTTTTARRYVERLKRRDYSSTWKIPDGIMPELIERASRRLAEMFGGLDAPLLHEHAFGMRVARLPA